MTAVAVTTTYGFQSSVPNRPWPPEVQPAPPQSPPLSPEDALESYYMPPGFRVELVASEPLVQEPVAMDWDVNGRLWIVEMPGFMADLRGSNEHDPIGRVVVLEDTDEDGRMDKRTVFADRLILARAIKVLERGVLVAEPPNLWLMTDTNGDLKMDARTLVSDKYGRFEADPQNNANGLYWALDNRMHTAGQADIHLRWRGDRIETAGQLQRGEWGVTQDDAGRIYRNTNESALHVDLVPTFYYARNPNLLRTRGSYDRLATGNEELNVVWPVRPNPGTNRAYQVGIDRPDGTLAKFTSVCAPAVYRGDRLPADLYGNVFVAEPAANLVSRLVVEEGDGGLSARKAYPRGEFLASTDERFRPVYLSNAPDGTLYVADMYRGIIEHRISITEYLRDQILERRLDRGTGYGRIYRVVHDSPRDRGKPLVNAGGAQLVQALSHPNGWWRDTAQRMLVERGDRGVVAALVARTAASEDWRTRLHALWTLDGLDALEPATVLNALADPRPEIRTSAVRLSERWLSQPQHPVVAALARLADDGHWWVRQQLAATLGFLPPGIREDSLEALLRRGADDPVLLDAAMSSLRGAEAAMLARMMGTPAATSPVETAISMLAATTVRGGEDAAIQRLLALVAQQGSEWQRSAVLRGVEVAVLGAAMPGSAGGRRTAPAAPAAALPCPTCPGGRAGPGGAYAFPRPPNWRSGQGQSGTGLRLTRAPAELIALAAGGDPLAQRAGAVLARVVWPGKPGAPAAAAALTPAESRRFEDGRELYRNVCQGCHQPDGRGQDRIAPSLVGSVLALAPADIPARVLLHGKEGTIGLMPPIGASFSDEQVAAVLTYIRREWGHSASAVTPQQVAKVRAGSRSRTRPWRHDELLKLLPPDPALRQ